MEAISLAAKFRASCFACVNVALFAAVDHSVQEMFLMELLDLSDRIC
jgi:hypothetical protein